MTHRSSPQTISLWYPLFDTPVDVQMSLEQLQAIADELRGVNVYPGWKEHFAGEIEKAMSKSPEGLTGSEPTA